MNACGCSESAKTDLNGLQLWYIISVYTEARDSISSQASVDAIMRFLLDVVCLLNSNLM